MKRSVLFRPLLMVGVLVLAMLACLGGGAAPAATGSDATMAALQSMATAASVELTRVAGQNAQPPQQPEQPPTEVAGPTEVPSAAEGQQYFTENFDTDSGQWSHFVVDASILLTSPRSLPSVDSSDPDHMSLQVTDGHLAFDLGAKGLWVYALYDGAEYNDVKMEVTADNRGVNDNNVSLICRYSQENGWYEFNIANNGLYDILYGKLTPDNKAVYRKIADGGSNKIHQGKDTNTYGISCKGRTLVLTINGFETRRLTDNEIVLDSGKVGVSVSSFNALPVNVLMDTVTISQP